MEYIPDGLSKEQWKAIKEKDAAASFAAKRALGRVGTTKFKSRSFTAWQEAMERGEGGHLFPVDPRDVKSGKIKLSEVPYMQRGGSWDDEDLINKEKGIKKKQWSPLDKKYKEGGERLAQSVNIFGTGRNLPWLGGQYKPEGIDPVKEQAKYKRATSNLPPNKMALMRREKELAELAKKKAAEEAKLAASIEKKRGWFW